MFRITLAFQSILNRWLSCLLIILTLSASIDLILDDKLDPGVQAAPHKHEIINSKE